MIQVCLELRYGGRVPTYRMRQQTIDRFTKTERGRFIQGCGLKDFEGGPKISSTDCRLVCRDQGQFRMLYCQQIDKRSFRLGIVAKLKGDIALQEQNPRLIRACCLCSADGFSRIFP